MTIIREIIASPSQSPSPSRFQFQSTEEAAEHNWEILSQSDTNLGRAITHDGLSPLNYGSEFKPTQILSKLFHLHPLWPRLRLILDKGINYPLSPLSTSLRKKDLCEALEFKNHKGVKTNATFITKLLDDDVIHGYSLILPLRVATKIPNGLIAPMNVIEQNTITQFGEVVPKKRMTHNQSKIFDSSGTSVNGRVDKDLLQACMFGHCITRMIHFILALRRAHPYKRILIQKIDYKSAYRRAHLNWQTAIQSMTQHKQFLYIALRATFGGSPNPFEWGVISESITDLANLLMNDDSWDPSKLCSDIQQQIPPDKYIDDSVPFQQALPTIVSPPVDCCAKADVYIDDTTTISLDDPKITPRARAAVPLAIHIVGRPISKKEPLPRNHLISIDKLKAEGRMEEVKIDLGWHFDTRRLLVSLSDDKFKAWSLKIKTMLANGQTNHDELDTVIGQLTHVTVILPCLLHFLSRLRSLKYSASRRRNVRLHPKHRDDLQLALRFLSRANSGISMNYISYRSPTHCYRADACPWGIGGYSANGRAWRWEIPRNLLWRATLNMLEFVAATIGPWIDILEDQLPSLSCILSMTDSTTTNGWLKKSNFADDSEDENDNHLACKMDLARSHSLRLLDNDVKEYSQWFAGKFNDVSDALSRDFHLNNEQLTNLLTSAVPSQLPPSFSIAPLPPAIESYLYVWLARMPARQPSREIRKRSGLHHGADGSSFSNPSNLDGTHSSNPSTLMTPPPSSPVSPTPSEKPNILHHLSASWLQAQSELPWTMWHRPSGTTATRTHGSTKDVSLHAFYLDSTRATRIRTSQPNNRKRSHHQFSTNSNPTLPQSVPSPSLNLQ